MNREEFIKGMKEFRAIVDNCPRPSLEEMQKNIELCKKTIYCEEPDDLIFGIAESKTTKNK